MARRMPLSHAAPAATFAKICRSGAIISQQAVANMRKESLGDTTEVVLGTENNVFLYAAPFRYPGTDCGFLFRRDLEDAADLKGAASPFDSGALEQFKESLDLGEAPRDFLAHHALPLPGHRDLLADTLTWSFRDPEHYIDLSSEPIGTPVGLSEGDRRRWTHEVRIQDSLPIQGPEHHLEAVFIVRSRGNDPEIERYLTWCEETGVSYRVVDEPGVDRHEALKRACVDYLENHLALGGVTP